MKTTLFMCGMLAVWIPLSVRAESAQISRQDRLLMAINEPTSKNQLTQFCDGEVGHRFCESYISAVLVSVGIRYDDRNCVPVYDLSTFLFEPVWDLTVTWINQQPDDQELKLYDAIVSALDQQNACQIK